MNRPWERKAMTDAGDPLQVRYERPAPKIARIVLDRPQKRNAQGTLMTYHLEAAVAAGREKAEAEG